MTYWTGTLEQLEAVNVAYMEWHLAQKPNDDITQRWASPRQTVQAGVYAMLAPPQSIEKPEVISEVESVESPASEI